MFRNTERMLLDPKNEKNISPDKPIITDPFGSYTGLTASTDDTPVQDADDL